MSRPARPARSPAPPLPAFEVLDQTHRQILEHLGDFGRLLDHVDDNGPDEQARQLAGRLMAFFQGHAREHHAQEESVVFPPLLAGPDTALAGHVRRLQQDHGWLEQDWLELAPQLEAISRGYNWYDLAMLRAALPVFAELYRDHIALEESLVYPASKRRHQAMAEGEAARRGH
jgi:hemerythrin-like domain-containing protein